MAVGLTGGPPRWFAAGSRIHHRWPTPLDANIWGDYLGIRADIALGVFTDAEARELLSKHGVTNSNVIDLILGLTNRLPVWVASLAEKAPESVDEVSDPSDDAVERFLEWEPDERRQSAALLGAFPGGWTGKPSQRPPAQNQRMRTSPGCAECRSFPSTATTIATTTSSAPPCFACSVDAPQGIRQQRHTVLAEHYRTTQTGSDWLTRPPGKTIAGTPSRLRSAITACVPTQPRLFPMH